MKNYTVTVSNCGDKKDPVDLVKYTARIKDLDKFISNTTPQKLIRMGDGAARMILDGFVPTKCDERNVNGSRVFIWRRN